MLVALEVQHAVYHVLQHLRPGDGALFIDVADDKNGDILALGKLHQCQGALLYLPYSAWDTVAVLVIQRLDGVDDQHIRLFLLGAGQHVAQPGLGQHQKVPGIYLQALGPHPELASGFLAGDIEHPGKLAQSLADLQHQRGFADARRTAHQHQRALYRAAAQHPIQLSHSGGEANLFLLFQRCNRICLYKSCGRRVFSVTLRLLRLLLHHAVPCAADRALPCPLGTFAAALGAEIGRCLFHSYHLFTDIADSRSRWPPPASSDIPPSAAAPSRRCC